MFLPDSEEHARQELEESLRTFIAEGNEGLPDESLAQRYEQLIEQYFGDRSLTERERVSALYRKAFGIGQVREEQSFIRQPPFRDVVGTNGWFADFLRYARPAKAMPQLFFGAALAFIGAALGHRPRIRWSVEGLYPNVYVLLIGDTGAGKGTAIKRAQRIIEPALAPNILPDEGSHQGYARGLHRRWVETGTHADGLIIAEELRMLLSNEKYKDQLTVWLTAWYSKEGAWSRAVEKSDEFYFENPRVSCLFASNMSWLKLTPGDAILGGFWPRFLKFHTPESEMRWGEFDPEFDERLEERLTKRLAAALDYIPDEVTLTDEAREWAREWYRHELGQVVQSATHERVKDWYNRCSAHLMKIACIWQFADGKLRDSLELEYLQRAWRVLQWMQGTIYYMYGAVGVSPYSTVLVDVLEKIEAANGEIEGQRLIRSLRNKYRAPQVRAALLELEQAGDIIQKQGVKKGIYWELVR